MEAKLMIREDNSISFYEIDDNGIECVLFDSLDESDNSLLAWYISGLRPGIDYEVEIA